MVPFLPGHLVNTHVSWGGNGGKLLLGQFFEVLPVDPIDHFIVEAEIPPCLLIGGDGGQPVYLISKAFGESAPEPVKFFDADAVVFNAKSLALRDMQEYPLSAHGEILDNHRPYAMNGRIVDMTAAGADGRDETGRL